MQSTRLSPLTAFHADSGIAQVSRQVTRPLSLPVQVDLQPSALAENPQLDQLFALTTLDDFIHQRLAPDLYDLSVLTPSIFSASLAILRTELPSRAGSRRELARRLGKLASLLDEQEELGRLVRLYCSALLQG